MMHHHRPYTLIEVLAAVAVLVLMMSFLFQFTAGAQRIWSASNTQTTIADNADTIFAMLSGDLTQMQVDAELNMKYDFGTDKFSFFTLSTRDAGTGDTDAKVGSLLYVVYQVKDKKLYRFQKNVEDTDGTPLFSSTSNVAPAAITFTPDDEYLLAEGVEEFTVKTASTTSADQLPAFIRVDVKLDNPHKRTDDAGNSIEKFTAAKSYSQVFFVGMR